MPTEGDKIAAASRQASARDRRPRPTPPRPLPSRAPARPVSSGPLPSDREQRRRALSARGIAVLDEAGRLPAVELAQALVGLVPGATIKTKALKDWAVALHGEAVLAEAGRVGGGKGEAR